MIQCLFSTLKTTATTTTTYESTNIDNNFTKLSEKVLIFYETNVPGTKENGYYKNSINSNNNNNNINKNGYNFAQFSEIGNVLTLQ